MICIYHSRDLDGYTSGAIVKRKFPDAIMIGHDYGKPLVLPEYHPEPIIMVDVSEPMPKMLEIAKLCNYNFTWIDHHKSAIKEFNDFVGNGESFCKAVLQDGKAACEIAWEYLFPDEDMPLAVQLLGEYDTWRNQNIKKWEERILPFQFGMRMECSSPETFPVSYFSDNSPDGVWPIQCVINNGKTILKYQSQVNEKACHGAFEFEFEGLRAICLNGGGFNSDVFKSVYNPEKHDIMMPFCFNGKFWTISLYTTHDHIDCSVIAKLKGGGGHKKAAGFQSNDLKFLGI